MNKAKDANQLVNRIVNQVEVVQQPDVEQINGNQHAAWEINNVIRQLQTCFPAWRSNIKSQAELNAVKQTWARALIENNVTSIEQIAIGMQKARASSSDFFPSVGKFISWCLGTDEKADPEQQAIEAQQRRQADTSIPLLRKKPTEEEIDQGNDALAKLKGMF